ncbi:4-hydroxy-3-methylbut-2-enyl diphosphate reductase [Aldersonia sp. NBC_00410]|uniref:4-hydroxy-3-methylbut-2-enyl diphosphate reductase n=1 Tax=Aldersonia sp. NBC_00410 TaxID=2975954 RepID=UPI002B1DDBA5|nr:4-hydroxy-3-methylbut-2-enyl diphosphate reductase [Aldersonia sp. NBC_00410]
MTAYAAATVCTPLRSEYAALRGRVAVPVRRTGRGPDRRLPAAGPVLVAGVAGALGTTLRPGDVVVASELRTRTDTLISPAAVLLAAELRRLGLPTHLGPLLSTDRVVDGKARSAAAATGAIAVDTESAFLAAQAPAGQTVALRTIVDTPESPLLRPGTAWRGYSALRMLRAAAPAIDAWAAATGERELLLAGPRSFCAGVERAVEIVERALAQSTGPVYVRRQIVHNRHVIDDLRGRGAIFVDEVDQIPAGSVAVLAAHGVAPSVRRAAAARSLRVIDATCPLVAKVHSEVRRFAAKGNTVLLIGHDDHEEVVGTRGEAQDNVIVVPDPAAAEQVSVPDPDKVSYVMQTTLAADEAERTAEVLRARFPMVDVPTSDDICYATTNRQQAVRAVAREADLVLVLGSQNSSNSHRLAEVAARCGVPAHLVDDAGQVQLSWLAGARRVGITAGASAPPQLVDELVACLSGLGTTAVRDVTVVNEDIRFTLPREVS